MDDVSCRIFAFALAALWGGFGLFALVRFVLRSPHGRALAGRLRFFDERFRAVFAGEIVDRDITALTDQFAGDRLAEALSAACDQCTFAF